MTFIERFVRNKNKLLISLMSPVRRKRLTCKIFIVGPSSGTRTFEEVKYLRCVL